LASLYQEIPDYLKLELDVSRILTEQELHGWYFDETAARELAQALYAELETLEAVLRNRYPFVAGREFTPKRVNRSLGYVEGATCTKLIDFNPSSRDHIAWIMQTLHGWKPDKKTKAGKTAIDETVLKEIGTEEALQFYRCLELTKQLGMLSEGKNAYLKLVKDNRIHHHCSVATNTHRCAHRNPNLAQVPSDLEFRKLFRASPGNVMVGADLSGIELRMLAHYLARYDGGAYGDVLLNGDIHQVNADKIGISRRLVKTVTYAFLYGAGDQKIGLSYDPLLPPNKAKEKGAEIRGAYVSAIDGLADLLSAVRSAGERGFIKAIDGRKIPVDSPHKCLNYLLQSSAGVVAKRWMAIANDNFPTLDNDYIFHTHQLAFVHDELQFECLPAYAEDLKDHLELCASLAGEYYNLRIPIAAEGKIGSTWADVH
jgi:DNA polymerase I-like protein with 3'-5' exonuclease and polymerase domains